MKQQEIVEYATTINVERMELLSKRNTDYSEQDVDNGLSNFHDVSAIARTLGINIKASEFALLQAILKLVRDANKKRLGESPDSAVREDNQVDVHNYIDLSALCELEEKNPDVPWSLNKKVFDEGGSAEGIVKIDLNEDDLQNHIIGNNSEV